MDSSINSHTTPRTSDADAPCSLQQTLADPAVLQRARDIESAVAAATGSWRALFRSEALRALCLMVASSAPSLPTRDLVTLGKLGAWICAFDDFADDASVDEAELALRISQYELLICGHESPELAFDPIAGMFIEILDALRAAPLGPSLWPLFSTQLMASLQGMLWERSAATERRAGHLTSIDVYLRHASESICVGLVGTAAAMLLGETTALSHISLLLTAERHAATVVRIANDEATSTREQAEANVNVFGLCSPEDILRLPVYADAERNALSVSLARLGLALPLTARFLRRLTDLFLDVYTRGDLTDV